MIFGIFTLLVALAVAGVAAWFSIVGLMAIFAASALSIAIMATALEIAKLVTASWLYQNWRVTGIVQKTYLTIAVVALMAITSMGIFGYLSKAHLEQKISVGGDNALQISTLERRIANQRRTITDAETVLEQLDQTVQTLIDYDRIRGPSGSIATREAQKPERDSLNGTIVSATANIEELQAQLFPLQKQSLELEAEVGPLKYVAELVYGDSAEDTLDQAVRLFIILLVVVFDPLAVMLVIAANQTLMRHGIEIETQYKDTHEPQQLEQTQSDTLQSELQELRARAQTLQASVDAAKAQPEVIEVEVERVVEVPVEVERIVEREVPVEVERIVEKEVVREVEVPVERIVEREVEKVILINDAGELVTDDLDTAVRMWMEINEDADVTEEDIRETFINNEKDLKNAQGFWAFPLPKSDKDGK